MIEFLAQLSPSATTETDLYVVPIQKVTSCRVCVCNRGAASDVFRLMLARAGASTAAAQYLYYDMPILGNDTYWMPYEFSMGLGDILRVRAGTGDLSFNFFGDVSS